MRQFNPEIRAAEIYALIATTYRYGGWFACMTRDEQTGWDKHEEAWWHGDPTPQPSNSREWAGWLAAEIWTSHRYDS